MVAFGEPQLFQGHLEREGSRPAEAGSDHLDGHVVLASRDRRHSPGRLLRASIPDSSLPMIRMPAVSRVIPFHRPVAEDEVSIVDRIRVEVETRCVLQDPSVQGTHWHRPATVPRADTIEDASARSAQVSTNIIVINRARTHRCNRMTQRLRLVRCTGSPVRQGWLGNAELVSRPVPCYSDTTGRARADESQPIWISPPHRS